MSDTPSQTGAFLVGTETCVLIALRLGLFYASRRYLLRNLYHDLQGLSSEVEPLLSSGGDDIELDTLPTPTTANGSGLKALKGTFHSTLSRTLFSLCFSESCTLFALLIFQGLDIFHARTLLFNWTISLFILVGIIVILIPLAYSLVLSYRSSSGKQTIQRPSVLRILLTALPVGVFLFFLSFIPLPAGFPSASLWQNVLSRLTVVGTLILGFLSGFGAVSNAWDFFPSISRKKAKRATDEDVRVAEEGLQRIKDDLVHRKRTYEQMIADQPEGTEASWFSKVASNFRSDDLTSIKQEIAGLEALDYQMSRNLLALRTQRAEDTFSRTITGRLWTWVGRLFAVYCVYRIVMSTINVVFPARPVPVDSPAPDEPAPPRTDFITVLLAHLLSFAPAIKLSTEDIALVSRQMSLILVGLIIASSIRRVLWGVARVLRVTSRRLGASLMLLMVAQVMGIYLLSTLVQLRTSFPPSPLRPDTQPDTGVVNLFSTLPEFQVFGLVFDSAFLIAAAATALVFWFNQRINSVGVLDTS